MSAPLKHHYLPVFYLKRWAGADRKICEFSVPYGRIYKRRIYPVQTGFVERLYEMKGVPAAVAQQVEEEFMKPIDTFASISLAQLERGDEQNGIPIKSKWGTLLSILRYLFHRQPVVKAQKRNPIDHDPRYRSAWSLFIMTLLMRMPEDLKALSAALEAQWETGLKQIEKKYAASRQPSDPITLQEFIDKNDPGHMERWTLNVARFLMDHEGIGQLLNNMRWFVVNTIGTNLQFLTSDRPVIMSATLTEPDAYLFLPIGPQRVFVAVLNAETGIKIWRRPLPELVSSVNDVIAGHAIKYVYGCDDSQLKFVGEHIFKRPQKSLMEHLAERYR